MPNLRFEALRAAESRNHQLTEGLYEKASEIFASKVFHLGIMKQYLPKDVVELLASPDTLKIDRKVADMVANAMKSWALANGVTHYTHWFQPLTGLTAEKHDAFFDLDNGQAIEKFTAGSLVQQEPDASSFPSGGIRSTFEARGYTAWDVTSPAFIIGTTLCIPSMFISYTGEALDYKTPLLKTIELINKTATDVCQLFDKNIERVGITLGPEQEYFLIDAALFHARPDLMMTGRTLIGARPARGQQLEDHYFGSIPARVQNFMQDLENECLLLGIPIKTRHNEVAPGQFECAPIFEEMNIAIDHNQLLSDIMEKVAKRHNFRVLLHEKPFAGVNGSGKHNNWSLVTNTGKNLLSPGKTQKDNLLFLTFFVNTLKAIFDQADLLRSSVATAGNDHRLGANEAPPAIISAFIGSYLDHILNQLEEASLDQIEFVFKSDIKLGIQKMPELAKDNTDRNRTSPFAFTGNKFEFRAVGSSANCAPGMIILNTIVANQLVIFKQDVEAQIAKGLAKDQAVLVVLREYIKISKPIRFEGDGYSEEWKQEAAKRGLSNITTTPRALDILVEQKTLDLFSKHQIFSEEELKARHEIRLESYVKKRQIEAKVLLELLNIHVIPAGLKYLDTVASSTQKMMSIGYTAQDLSSQHHLIKSLNSNIQLVYKGVEKLNQMLEKAHHLSIRDEAIMFSDEIMPLMEEIRKSADTIEDLVDDSVWPLPKYREMMFVK